MNDSTPADSELVSAPAVVLGLGEIGGPIRTLLSAHLDGVLGVDPVVAPGEAEGTRAPVMHVCYPFQIQGFVGETARYAERFRPELIIVHSTVSPGTSDAIAKATSVATAYSPVRGKHARMLEELKHYRKFVAGAEGGEHAPTAVAERAVAHLSAGGFPAHAFGGAARGLELAKLAETTYFGLLIAWAQELDRAARAEGADYERVLDFFDEVGYLPPTRFTPGHIGGHCVMPNVDLLREAHPSPLLDAIVESNDRKRGELEACEE